MVLAFLTAIITAYIILIFYSDSNLSFAKAISPHISTLIETQDGPELQRFVKAISREKEVKIEVSKNREIIASSADSTSIGRPVRDSKGINILGVKNKISLDLITSKVSVQRIGGPKNLKANIFLYSPTFELFGMVFFISAVGFIFSFLMLNIFATKIIMTAQESIGPIKQLERSINELRNFGDINFAGYMYIEELENIYNAILETNSKLKNSNDKLAKSKARKITINAYKKLIHDLHTPIAALKQMIRVANKQSVSQNKKDSAKARITEIAEQILLQIKASKENLKIEVLPKNNDLNESIRKATGQAQMALIDRQSVKIVEKYDENLKPCFHDSLMLGRAVSNIVVNAIEACKSLVEISVTKLEKGVSILVEDDGEGIGQENVSLFLQGRGKSNKKNGSGIGLASANHIVRLHGGKIIYKQSYLGGACFDIRIQG